MSTPTELETGDPVTYHAPWMGCAMRRATIVIERTDTFAAIAFDDGTRLLAPRRYVTRMTAPRYEPDF